MPDLIAQFRAARRVSTPLIAISTPDQAATIKTLTDALVNGTTPPALQWDLMRGITPLNDPGKQAAREIGADPLSTSNPAEALDKAASLPPGSVLFLHNAHRLTESGSTTLEPSVSQALANLRDPYKTNRRTCVLLSPGLKMPTQLQNDVLLLDEPLPTIDALCQTVKDTYGYASLPEPDADTLQRATDALSGLSSYAAEQAAALCLTPEGLDLSELWETKRRLIEGKPGLRVYRGSDTFADLAGLDNIKTYLARLLRGRERPRAILFLDEIEKMVAGSGDTSGTSQALNEAFLSWSQDSGADGLILLGVPGAGKSATAKAAAGEAGIPCIMASLSQMKGSLVGESEGNIREALKTVDAIAQGSVLMIATCNGIGALTPEIQSRFKLGTFFYDYPQREERSALWRMYQERYRLPEQDLPADSNWVGREIEAACRTAYRLDVPIAEAARTIVPISTSRADVIEPLRRSADGRYIDATHPGLYRYPAAAETATTPTGRALTF